MKTFDLEQAKAGKPIVTRDGRDAKFIAHVPEARFNQKIVVMIGDKIDTRCGNGEYFPEVKGISDLFMKTVKKTVYVNIWFGRACLECSSQTHDSLQSATNAARLFEDRNYLAIAVPIEIEE